MGTLALMGAGPLAAGPPPDTTAPTITSATTKSVAENATLSHSLTADETVTWSIVGGADQAKFELSGSTLRWTGNGTKNYEVADDADANHAYVVTVRATDGAGNTTDQTVTVTVTDVNEAPTDIAITWGSAYAGGNIPDGTAAGTTVGTISGTDPEGNALTFAEVTDATNTFTLSGTSLTLTSQAAYSAGSSRSVTIRATDTASNTYDETFTALVLAPNAIDPAQFDSGTLVLSNGGKTATKISGTTPKGAKSKVSVSDKSQFEFAVSAMAATMAVGLATAAVPTSAFPDGSAGLSVLYRSDGTIWKNGAQVASGYPTFGAGDTIMGAFDAATGKVWFGKNGTWQGSPAAGTGNAATADSGVYYPAVYLYGVNDSATIKTAASELTTALQTGFSPAYSSAPVLIQSGMGSTSVSLPTRPTSGNLLVALVSAYANPVTAASGWTLVTQATASSDGTALLYKIAGPSEAGDQWPISGSLGFGFAAVFELAKYDGTSWEDVYAQSTNGSGASGTLAITTVSTDAHVLGLIQIQSTTTTVASVSGATILGNQIFNNRSAAYFDALGPTAGAKSYTATLSGPANWQWLLVAVKPGSAGTTGASAPTAIAGKILMEDGTSSLLMEDGASRILLEG